MIYFDLRLLSSATVILLIASAKCCIFTPELTELGKLLLKYIGNIEFSNYAAIEDFKRSVEFAVEHSIVATPEEVREAAIFTKIHHRQVNILEATDIIYKHFNTVFSLVTPHDDFDMNGLEKIFEEFDFSISFRSSVSLFQGLFARPWKIQHLIKTYKALPYEYHCKSTTSVHHKVVALHNRAILNLIMGFSTMMYIFKQARLSPERSGIDPTALSYDLPGIYDQFVEQTQGKLNDHAKAAPRDIHRCDSIIHEYGKTYDGLYELVDNHLTSERFLNEHNQCSTTSKNYHGVKHPSEIEKYIDSTIRCHGTLYQCSVVDLQELFLSNRDDMFKRHHGFSVTKPSSSGRNETCSYIPDATITFTRDHLNGVGRLSPGYPHLNLPSAELNRLKSCPIYQCHCDHHDSPRTVRYFSTKLVTSAVEQDRVITGLRLKVQGRVLYIQAQTGQLVGLGVVDPDSVKWERIEPVDITRVDEESPNAEFVKLDYNSRSLYLDDLSSDKGYYLTGVQFTRANGGVRIAAKFTPFKVFTLVTDVPHVTLQASDINRTERKPDYTKISFHIMGFKSEPISVQNRDYIQFQPSDIGSDVAQTTVPFLDIQPVVTNPPTALGGFGIYLKGHQDSGSFVALKLLSAKY